MRILVVDDDASILECTRTFLEKAGHEVVTCAGIFEACTALSDRFDVVICDGFGGPGLEFLFVLRRVEPTIKTILHSADSRLVEQERARGYCGIVKGDSWDEVMRAVGEK